MELVSVLMSTYNEEEKWLRQSIESILNQTWAEIEFIIINDNPNNFLLWKILCEYENADKRIHVFQNKKNIGLAKTMNQALKRAKGEYIARMDADDISMPARIQHEMEYMKKHSLDLVASGRIDITEKGEIIGKEKIFPSHRRAEKLLPYGNMITHPSILAKKQVLLAMHGYRELVPAEDYDLWLRILDAGYKIGIVDEALLYYRNRGNGISRTNYYRQFLISQYVRKLYRKRKRHRGKDYFLPENLRRYEKRKYTETKKIRFHKAYGYFDLGVEELKNGKTFLGIVYVGKAVFSDYHCASDIIRQLRYEIKRWSLR